MYFTYGEKETDYLKAKDQRLGSVIDEIGPIRRETDPDLFSSLIHQILGQQISSKAQATLWMRLQGALGTVTPDTVAAADPFLLKSLGISPQKSRYIRELAGKIVDASFDLEGIRFLSDEEAIRQLTSLSGVGTWTAEMILLFCLERPDILSYSDLGIQRGLRMVYRHRTITREQFEQYRRRYSPYGSVASLYLWAVAGGAIEGMKDPAPRKPQGNALKKSRKGNSNG